MHKIAINFLEMERRMHIGVVMWYLFITRGGVETFGAKFVRSLIGRGHSITIFHLKPEKEPDHAPPGMPPDVSLIPLDLAQHTPEHEGVAERLAIAKERIAQSGIDVLVSLLSMPPLMLFPYLLRGTGIPFLLSHRGDPQSINHLLWNPYENMATMAAADRVHVQLPSYREYYPEFLRKSISAIANPVRKEPRIFPLSQESSPRKKLIAAGRFSEGSGKQYGLLISAFALLATRFPDWDLILCGDGKSKKDYEQQIASCGLAGRVFLPGMVSDMPNYYNQAHLFCHPSRREGFPNVVVEAQSFGLPVVGFADTTGTNEIVVHGENGLLAKENTAPCLAENLAVLMGNTEQRQAMGKRAWELLSRYDEITMMDQWEALLLETAACKGNTRLQQLDIQQPEEYYTIAALREILSRPTPFARCNNAELTNYINYAKKVRRQVRELEHQLRQTEAAPCKTRKELQRIRNSLSWKITRPLRKAIKIFRTAQKYMISRSAKK